MPRPATGFRTFGLCLIALLAAYCGGSDLVLPNQPPSGSPPPSGATRIEPTGGNDQSGIVGTTLAFPLAVKVTSQAGDPVEGVTVGWTAANGGGVSASTSTTNAQGIAQVLRTLGAAPGPYSTQAEAAGLSGSPVLFNSTGMPVGTNQPPAAGNDEYPTIEGATNTLTVGTAEGVLHNDSDPEGGPLEATDASDPPNGKVKLSSDGSFTYNPEVNFFGDDQFTYRARDPEGNASTATVTVHVTPVNDAPQFSDQGKPHSAKENEGPQVVSGWARDISPGADNEAGQTLQFLVVFNSDPDLFAPGGQPAVTLNGPESTEGTLTYTPNGRSGRAFIAVVLKDNGGTENGGADTSVPHSFEIEIKH